jgi:hypothetical protein
VALLFDQCRPGEAVGYEEFLEEIRGGTCLTYGFLLIAEVRPEAAEKWVEIAGLFLAAGGDPAFDVVLLAGTPFIPIPAAPDLLALIGPVLGDVCSAWGVQVAEAALRRDWQLVRQIFAT